MLNYIGATVQAVIDSPPATLWALISDFERHPQLAGSGEVTQTESLTSGPLTVGSRFQSQQNLRGFRYTTISHVVACDEARRLAWRIGLPGTPPFAQVWQFELTPSEGGTLVKHGVALPYVVPHIFPFVLVTDMVASGEVSSMQPTLVNLARLAGAPSPTNIEGQLQPPASAAALLPSPLLQGSLWIAGTAVLGAMAVRRSTGQQDSTA